ncbi:MAG: O-antigen ligase family protein [Pseudomonadota bacterium]
MSLFILLLTLTVYIIRPGEWVSSSDVRWNLALNVIGAIVVALVALTGNARDSADRTWLYVWGFFAWMIVSSVLNFQFDTINGYFTGMLTNLLVFMLVSLSIRTERQARIIVGFFTVLVVFVAWQCYVQVTQGTNIVGDTAVARFIGYDEVTGRRLESPQARWLGVFYDPNDTGMLLLSLAPLAFAWSFFNGKRMLVRCVWAAVFAAETYAIFLTNSRGTMLALLASIIVLFVVRYRSAIGLFLASACGFLIITLGPSRLSSLSSADDSSMERVYAWILALELFAIDPVLGVGPMHFMDHHHMTTHNSFVLAVVENGFPGYVLYMAIFFTALFVSARVAYLTEDHHTRITASALTACTVGMMACAFFISRTYVLLPFFLMALVLGYTRALTLADYKSSLSALRVWWIGVAAAASVVFVWLTNRLTTMLLL